MSEQSAQPKSSLAEMRTLRPYEAPVVTGYGTLRELTQGSPTGTVHENAEEFIAS